MNPVHIMPIICFRQAYTEHSVFQSVSHPRINPTRQNLHKEMQTKFLLLNLMEEKRELF